MDTTTFTQYILGDSSMAFIAAMLFYCILGLIASLLLNATDRNPASAGTPREFNLWFLIKDNHKRILVSLVLIVVLLTVGADLFDINLNKTTCFLLGFQLDKLAQAIKNRSSLLQVTRN